ncbi:MAG: NAD(P)/FAD-dependent oxidoreductase, partial [Actinomycetota bacterium]
ATDRVVLVDRRSTLSFAPSLLWVMSGARRADQIAIDLRRLRRRGIEIVATDVLAIEPVAGNVETGVGAMAFDRLVVALGADLAPDDMPGFSEGAHNVYSLEGATSAGEELRRIPEGRLVVLVSRTPYKCPAAPYETALLAEAVLRGRGVRNRCSIDVYTPEPYPMPTAGALLGGAVADMLAERGITLHAKTTTERIDPDSREIVLAGGERVGYDLLLGVPPHRAPDVVRDSGLAAESGFIPVDRGTLATPAEGVFAIGDVTTIPIAGEKFLPKAGVFAEGEAKVVSRRIADDLGGRRSGTVFQGKGSCFVEMGDGVAAFAGGDFYAQDEPKVTLRRPGRHWHLAKVAFERYWKQRWL